MLETKVNGLAELDKALAELADKMQRNIIRGALRAGMKEIQAEALRRVPAKTGALRESIRISTRMRRGVPQVTLKAGSKKAWYASLVEHGTARHLIKAKSTKGLFFGGVNRAAVTHPGSSKRPFMRPAMDAGSAGAVRAFSDYVRKRLSKQGLNVPAPNTDEG